MSVIGRLDEQVNDVMIKPLAERDKRAPEDAARAQGDERKSITSEDTPLNQEGSEFNERKRGEMPVWML
ncbi:MAG TPA: hypothetical protein VK619_12215 [Pyrinomonadaceae bacterium]|nr:hypothetical protein [Pyrinomonadaceae bacterium]